MYSSFFSTIHFIFVLWCKQMENNKQYLLKYMLHRDYKLFIMNYTNVFVQKFTWTNTSWAQAQAELGCGFRRLHVPPFQISDIPTSSKWRWSQVRRDNISSMILMVLRHYWLWSSWAWQWSLHTSTSSRHFYHTQHNIVIFSCLNKLVTTNYIWFSWNYRECTNFYFYFTFYNMESIRNHSFFRVEKQR